MAELGAALGDGGGEGEGGLPEEKARAGRAAEFFSRAGAGAAEAWAATERRVEGDVPRTEPGAAFLDAGGGRQRRRLGRLLRLYALQDPGVGYCQGMADLLAALLRVWPEDDVGVFWAFGALVGRLRGQFSAGAADVVPQLSRAAELAGRRDRALVRALRSRGALACPFLFQPVLLLLRRELSLPQTLNFWERYFALQSLHPGLDLRAALGAALLVHYRDDILALPNKGRGGSGDDFADLVQLFHDLPRPVDLDSFSLHLHAFVADELAEQGAPSGEAETTGGKKES